MSEIIEISTWEELLATVANQEYSWVGGSLDFNEIAPSGLTSTVTLRGSIDFNGATFFNIRSTAPTMFYKSGDKAATYLKNITFQNIEHIISNNNTGVFFGGISGITENVVVTGTIASSTAPRYILFHHWYSSYSSDSNNRLDRIGCNIVAQLSCPFFFCSESNASNPATSNRIGVYDSRITLDVTHTGDRPFPFQCFNCKIAGKLQSTSQTNIAINAFYSAISLETENTINCANLNLVRSDLATYAANSRLVECEAPFYEYKDDIADSGFPYNGAEWDGGD